MISRIPIKGTSIILAARIREEGRQGKTDTIACTPLIRGNKTAAMRIQVRGRRAEDCHRAQEEFFFIMSGSGDLKIGHRVRHITVTAAQGKLQLPGPPDRVIS